MNDSRILKSGDPVVFIDEHRQKHNALVTIYHGHKDGETIREFRSRYGHAETSTSMPCVNLLFVSGDVEKTDPYGRQIERKTSISHGSQQTPANLGFCFVFPDEVS